MNETLIVTIITSIAAPIIMLCMQNHFKKQDSKHDISGKLDKLTNKVDTLTAENKLQNEKIDKLEHDISKVNSNIQIDRKVSLKFMQLQTQMDKSLMVDMKKLEHNGDLLKAETCIEQFEQFIESDVFAKDKNTI